MQNGQDLFEWFQDFVSFPEFIEILRLFTNDGGNRLDGVTILEVLGERMFGQFYARLLLVVLQGDLKEYKQMRRSWLVSHARSRGRMWDRKGELVHWGEKTGR